MLDGFYLLKGCYKRAGRSDGGPWKKSLTSPVDLHDGTRGAAKKKMTKVTYICRSAKKKVVTYFILFLILFLIDFFLRRFLGVS